MSIEQAYEQIAEFARKRGAWRVALFGSRARADNMPKSDIDIAVESCPNYDGFEEDMQERLWSLLQVNIVISMGVSEALRRDIQREGKVLYEAL